MRSRPHAMGVAAVGTIVPFLDWMSLATVSLTFLRRGGYQGTLVLLAALAPAIALYMLTQNPFTVLMLVGAAILAMILRASASLELTLAATILVAWLAGLSLHVGGQEVLTATEGMFVALTEDTEGLPTMTRGAVAALMAPGFAFGMFGSLILGRWWQSVLYNPGGFKQEFQQLRLSTPFLMTLLVLLVLYVAIGDQAFVGWALLLTIPMFVSVISLAHWLIDFRRLGRQWVVGFYIVALVSLVLVGPLWIAVIAIADSLLNLRVRLNKTEDKD